MPQLPSPLHPVHDPLFSKNRIEVFMKRDDLIHPVIMGNKWRKLKYNLQNAKKNGYTSILTLGGAYSNHIVATAAAANENGLSSMGVIRGEELNEQSNPTLKTAAAHGMKLVFVTRQEYRMIREDINHYKGLTDDQYFLPEGGTNRLATIGCAEMIDEIAIDFDFLCTPVGTGGTMAGLLQGLGGNKTVMGFPVLKGNLLDQMFKQLINNLEIKFQNYQWIGQYHFGGYGKVTDQLVDFINDFGKKHAIKLDPIYTGKMVFGVFDLIKQGFFKENHKIILLHTGGVQGIEGYNLINHKKIL